MGLPVVLAAASGALSLIGGIQQLQTGRQQASAAKEAAALRGSEAARQAERNARGEQQNVDRLIRRQKLDYLRSGVTLEGSPLLVMEETRRRGAENIDEILRGGAYAERSAIVEGRTRARGFLASGRSGFISGLFGAAGSGGDAYELYNGQN